MFLFQYKNFKLCMKIYLCIYVYQKNGAKCESPHQLAITESFRSMGQEMEGAVIISVLFIHLYVVSLVTTRTEYSVVQKTSNKKNLNQSSGFLKSKFQLQQPAPHQKYNHTFSFLLFFFSGDFSFFISIFWKENVERQHLKSLNIYR